MAEEKSKKPDQVVFDEKTQKYTAALTPYATNLGAPAIIPDDITSWKNSNISKVNHQFKSQFDDIKLQYEVMMKKFEQNNLIYSAKFSFEPVLGEIYYLYRKQSGEVWLSLISPHECNWDYVGTFRLNSGKIWEEVLD
ncbi:DUF2452 domain-containing protein [Patiriisocius marinus]|uniref:GTP-binding protein n=1 Tax=Patiriisocius marinus TaxID=1397112 RepID=A0A5J4ILN7_9FLAO|nr:DUF2452 domain-containing protein [Patiriisocius marinus]GER57949.1 GTP-binding protein [Patiriisocius marinus]